MCARTEVSAACPCSTTRSVVDGAHPYPPMCCATSPSLNRVSHGVFAWPCGKWRSTCAAPGGGVARRQWAMGLLTPTHPPPLARWVCGTRGYGTQPQGVALIDGPHSMAASRRPGILVYECACRLPASHLRSVVRTRSQGPANSFTPPGSRRSWRGAGRPGSSPMVYQGATSGSCLLQLACC